MAGSSLYLLKAEGLPIVKVGIADTVRERAGQLPQAIDWPQSLHVLFPSRELAACAEKMLHAALDERELRRPQTGGTAGATEWFDESAMPFILAFLESNRKFLRSAEPAPAKEASGRDGTRLNLFFEQDLYAEMSAHCHQAAIATGRRKSFQELVVAAVRAYLA